VQVTFADGSTEQYEDVPLAQGAEGRIHRSVDKKSVVKLYHSNPQKDATRKDRIDKLISNFNPTKDDPYWVEFFTWPEKRVERPEVGYRMRFASGLRTLNYYIYGKSYKLLKPEEKGWFIGQIAAAMKLVSAADRMARMGLCYPDFSDKNIMIEPFEGKMVLIDCDSLAVPGKLPATIEGTSWYRAPEIVQEAVKTPSVETDRHALAVILYLWLLRGHPLGGDRIYDPTDSDNDEKLRLGEKATYIEHPTDLSNRNSKQVLKATALGPELEKLFRIAFADGLHEPRLRPMPVQWQQALYNTYDRIIPCASPSCGWRFFVATPTPRLTCPMCKQPLKNPQFLPFVYLFTPRRSGRLDDFNMNKSSSHYIVGWPGRYLHQWHVKPHITPIYSGPANVIDATPSSVFEYDERSRSWYVKNLNLPKLMYRTQNDPQGYWRTCVINTSIPLEHGLMLQFGDAPEYYRASVDLLKVD
jgi:DNA-binding helix-hairpin-helix protein with protein kinase domain